MGELDKGPKLRVIICYNEFIINEFYIWMYPAYWNIAYPDFTIMSSSLIYYKITVPDTPHRSRFRKLRINSWIYFFLMPGFKGSNMGSLVALSQLNLFPLNLFLFFLGELSYISRTHSYSSYMRPWLPSISSKPYFPPIIWDI